MQTKEKKAAIELLNKSVKYALEYDGEPQYIIKKQYIGMKAGDILKLVPDCEVIAKNEEDKNYVIEYYNPTNTRFIMMDIINDVCVFAMQTIGRVLEITNECKREDIK